MDKNKKNFIIDDCIINKKDMTNSKCLYVLNMLTNHSYHKNLEYYIGFDFNDHINKIGYTFYQQIKKYEYNQKPIKVINIII